MINKGKYILMNKMRAALNSEKLLQMKVILGEFKNVLYQFSLQT